MEWLYFIGVALFILAILAVLLGWLIIISNKRPRCPKCGKLLALTHIRHIFYCHQCLKAITSDELK